MEHENLKRISLDDVKNLPDGTNVYVDVYKRQAIITGKMFGNGIYFAPSAAKSWGYTSARGTRWARGTSNTAFMALFATAYGNPVSYTHLDVYKRQGYPRLL